MEDEHERTSERSRMEWNGMAIGTKRKPTRLVPKSVGSHGRRQPERMTMLTSTRTCMFVSLFQFLLPFSFSFPVMSGVRGSVTPTGKRSTFDYPLTGAQQAQHQQQTAQGLSTPISIQPRSSPRATGQSGVAAANAALNMAQSCPTFSWQPPPAPSARPRLASVDPPPMELPPSPPVFSPMQAETIKGKKEESTSVALKKQIYSRSLSNYSSSAPTHVDYLSKFHPNFAPLDEAGGCDDSDEDEEESTTYKASSRAMQAQRVADDDDDETPQQRGLGVAVKSTGAPLNRIHAVQRADDFSLSKSPTIFSILSTSQHNHAPLGLHTADTSASSSGSGSPGHSILGSIAVGAETGSLNKRRSMTMNKPPLAAKQPQPESQAEDDLQFSISLTDEQDGEAEDGKGGDFMPLY